MEFFLFFGMFKKMFKAEISFLKTWLAILALNILACKWYYYYLLSFFCILAATFKLVEMDSYEHLENRFSQNDRYLKRKFWKSEKNKEIAKKKHLKIDYSALKCPEINCCIFSKVIWIIFEPDCYICLSLKILCIFIPALVQSVRLIAMQNENRTNHL